MSRKNKGKGHVKSKDKASRTEKPERSSETAPETHPEESEAEPIRPPGPGEPTLDDIAEIKKLIQSPDPGYRFPRLPVGHEVILYEEAGSLMDLIVRMCNTAKIELTELDADCVVRAHRAMVAAQKQSVERSDAMIRMNKEHPLIEVPGFDLRTAFQALNRRFDRLEHRLTPRRFPSPVHPSNKVSGTRQADDVPWGEMVGGMVEMRGGKRGRIITEHPTISCVGIDFGDGTKARLPVSAIDRIKFPESGKVPPDIRFKKEGEKPEGNAVPVPDVPTAHTVDIPAVAQVEIVQGDMVMAGGPEHIKRGVVFRVGPKTYTALKDAEQSEDGERYMVQVEANKQKPAEGQGKDIEIMDGKPDGEVPQAGRITVTRRQLVGKDVLVRCTGSPYDQCIGGIAGYFQMNDGQIVYSVMFPGFGKAVVAMPSVMFRPPNTTLSFFDDLEIAQDANDKIPAYNGPSPLGSGVKRREKWYAVSMDDGGHPEVWDLMDTEPNEADRHIFKVDTWDEVCQLASRLDDVFAQLGATEEASDIEVRLVSKGAPLGKQPVWVGHPGEIPNEEPTEVPA